MLPRARPSKRSTVRSTCTFPASARRSKTMPRSRGASSRSAAPATCSPRRRIDRSTRRLAFTDKSRANFMRRLYLQVYLTIVASLALVVVAAGVVWQITSVVPPFEQPFEIAGEIVAEVLPPAGAPRALQQQAVDRL